jgi:hypothetical protein
MASQGDGNGFLIMELSGKELMESTLTSSPDS